VSVPRASAPCAAAVAGRTSAINMTIRNGAVRCMRGLLRQRARAHPSIGTRWQRHSFSVRTRW
jgi:hypothetical protein